MRRHRRPQVRFFICCLCFFFGGGEGGGARGCDGAISGGCYQNSVAAATTCCCKGKVGPSVCMTTTFLFVVTKMDSSWQWTKGLGVTLTGEERLTQHDMCVCVGGEGATGWPPVTSTSARNCSFVWLVQRRAVWGKVPAGTETAKDGGRGGDWGAMEGLSAYLTRDCHRQIDLCIMIGSNEKHFKASSVVTRESVKRKDCP